MATQWSPQVHRKKPVSRPISPQISYITRRIRERSLSRLSPEPSKGAVWPPVTRSGSRHRSEKERALRQSRSVLYGDYVQYRHLRTSSCGHHDPLRGFKITQAAYGSQTGFIPNNPAKVNQDSYILCQRLTNLRTAALIGVADGHGFHGHLVSSYIKQHLPRLISEETGIDFATKAKKTLTAAVVRCNAELASLGVDISLSGSTLTTALLYKDKVWCANVGDSRTILARCMPHSWLAIPLSRDHKPKEPSESARIHASGGRISPYKDDHGRYLGPDRVWLPTKNTPGLAMTRSLGDTLAATVGVTCTPEILEFQLTREDKFLLCATDGVFEFLSNEDVVRIVVPFYQGKDGNGACAAVMSEARRRWTQREDVIDDITCVLVFLDS